MLKHKRHEKHSTPSTGSLTGMEMYKCKRSRRKAKSKVVGFYGNITISPNIRGHMKETVNNMVLRGRTSGVWTVHCTYV